MKIHTKLKILGHYLGYKQIVNMFYLSSIHNYLFAYFIIGQWTTTFTNSQCFETIKLILYHKTEIMCSQVTKNNTCKGFM